MGKDIERQDRIEHALADVRNLLAKARALDVEDVAEIAEQFRVEAMLARSTRYRRHIYTAVADYFEHIADERKAERHDNEDSGLAGVVRAIVANFDDDEDDKR